MEPLISIIVPVYKTVGIQLKKCISSLLEQTYKNIEIIIVDDGNTDDYKAIFADLEEKDSRIRIHHQQNAGVSCARNKGIELAQGAYLSFVDSDDFLDISFYDKLMRQMADNDLVICGVDRFGVVDSWDDRRTFFSNPNLHNGLQYINFPVNKLYKRGIIEENHIHFDKDVKLGEDALFLAEYFKYCVSFVCVSDRLYYYVANDDSAVAKYEEKYWDWEQEVIKKQWEMFHQYPLSKKQEQGMLAWLYFKFRGAAYYYLYNETNKEIRKRRLKEIYEHSLFEKLKDCDLSRNNGHLSKREKIAIRLWKNFRILGMVLSYKLAK